VWARLPETIYQGTISCLSVGACLQLDSALTNREARPHLVKVYEDLVSPAFDQHVYTSENDFRALRWVIERGINLRGFRLELKDSSGDTVRESGDMQVWLMDNKRGYHDMEIAEYYATRGKLTNLYGSHSKYATQLSHMPLRMDTSISWKHYLQRELIRMGLTAMATIY
jgi:hypothetical protein